MPTVAWLPGDGIGPEVAAAARDVLKAVEKRYDHRFDLREALVGGAAIDQTGQPLPVDTLALCREADAVFLGAVGGPEWDDLPPELRPEKALLGIRKDLGVYANLRPVKVKAGWTSASPLKEELLGDGIDLLIVRELTGGIYFGQPRERRSTPGGEEQALDTMVYSTDEVRRVAEVAFRMAGERRKKVTSVDKANVLESSRLWRETVEGVAGRFPEVELTHFYVDNCAMQLVRNPAQFDVLVTGNMFGDILSDLASVLTGSLGMLPSASLGDGSRGFYEPVHGSGPDIAGKDVANPLGAILSVALMLRYSLGLEYEARSIEAAVETVLGRGYRTVDMAQKGCILVGTRKMGELVAGEVAGTGSFLGLPRPEAP